VFRQTKAPWRRIQGNGWDKGRSAKAKRQKPERSLQLIENTASLKNNPPESRHPIENKYRYTHSLHI
jgi:hypothetical protein